MWQNQPVSQGVPEERARTVPALVQLLARLNADRLRAEFAALGLDGLRPVHAVLLVPLLGGGRHAASLAADLGVTRQAVAQLVATLERDGYVQRIADPGDARAKLVCLTPRGRAALRVMRSSALDLEDRWRRELGPDRFAAFRETLLALLS